MSSYGDNVVSPYPFQSLQIYFLFRKLVKCTLSSVHSLYLFRVLILLLFVVYVAKLFRQGLCGEMLNVEYTYGYQEPDPRVEQKLREGTF